MRGYKWTRRSRPQPAALRQRLLAALIDSAAAMFIVVAAVAAGIVGFVVYHHARGADHASQARDDGEAPGAESRLPRSVNAALLVVFGSLSVVGRNWRGPGFRATGLRRVDGRTGGPVTVASAVSAILFDQAVQRATRPLTRPVIKQGEERLRALGRHVKEIEREHRDDPPEVAQRKVVKLHQEQGLYAGYRRALVPGLLLRLALAAFTRGGRSIRDRVTGTTVVVDR